MRYLAILIIVLGWFELSAQPRVPDKIQYLDYSSIVKDLKLKGAKSIYYSDLDFESMLYLDKSSLTVTGLIDNKVKIELLYRFIE